MAKRPTFKPLADHPRMIPATVVVPLFPGAAIHNVFSTGGVADQRRWINGYLNGSGSFYSLAEADRAADLAGGYLVTRGDHLAYIQRGGLFDPETAR